MFEQEQWQPTANVETLFARAKIINNIRRFFTDRGVLEVETPILSEFGVTDVHLSTFSTEFVAPQAERSKTLWLNTSPEYHMKRLLAAGTGAIFQLCHVFRNEEAGSRHNPEFTMLEWYRPHFDMYRLINEVDDLLQQILDCEPAESMSYQFAFQEFVGVDPLSAERPILVELARKYNFMCDLDEDRDTLLQFLFSTVVEPKIGQERPVAVYHFPATQAALAQISSEDHRVAERFEFYYKGLELANGFHELTDHREQLHRFEQDNVQRAKLALPQREIDRRLLGALQAGVPNTSGVALGVDRLVMIALDKKRIEEVMAFAINNA
ncbi:elongation factor P--(R)-beta-lysine ligase [Actinobacillus succinogenes]|uniref:Elongation factor P--(R)-beta-lysine ligase n=1 Tax=Actinobacillus succinogenes (strain ATCC 55618 / DSM 22257 / CCUG 43843 / 130Z) TaxID=339671 RepID=EPMA_ACTSZ|nr:elongation factor P--(R)-beta-lysine ligase [Actinobacillus succinogenes]A6VQ84.1 RecName: Full=Elongation factor P--(R)-beta-lysine ligase; Short=EF-P--(R)-beta-lysine ligase; AltName: Full=EF-P post-translational modification enzyme A; AltName: Full=EF-P-lysine lysyltransferase [Actinobacillus succinogenes 130Z]ABR75131.1 lysyl-tRNA synthetase-related protein GenX [Actinobacillus succinogenes 130Z]PHI40472.1 elongation factor P--(R)-beta-lysine ligase [Actinobacillus succinogenes]